MKSMLGRVTRNVSTKMTLSNRSNSIQEINVVYQGSSHPTAVLESEFQIQAELDAFSSNCDDASFDFGPRQIEVLESVLLVLSEKFVRAWTLQESVSAGLGMTLLLGCPGLRKPPHFGITPPRAGNSNLGFSECRVNRRIDIL